MVRLSGTISQAPKTQKKNGRSSGPPWPLWGQSWGALQEVLINPNGWMPHKPCQILGPTGRTNPKWRGEMMQNEAKASYRNSQKEASDLYVCKYIIYKYINIYVYIYTLAFSGALLPFCRRPTFRRPSSGHLKLPTFTRGNRPGYGSCWCWYGYGSIYKNTIFRGMNIHKSQLNLDVNYRGFSGFDTLPYNLYTIFIRKL